MEAIALNQPFYVYQMPMFMLTVSTVLIIDNGVILVEDSSLGKCCENYYKFPGGTVKSGQETIQFSAVRHIKEQTGIMLKKDLLIPVDFRSAPERSKEGNVVDIGFVCMIDHQDYKGTWKEVDFEQKKLVDTERFYMDHDKLLERAIEVAWMINEK